MREPLQTDQTAAPPAYTRGYYSAIREGSRQSAEAIVPLVLELIRPRNVVDIGCGTGTWLMVFREHGVESVFGIDGDWVAREDLEIPEECFETAELEAPLQLNRRFDLVVSLEVAEHLPPESAKGFVRSLTRLGDVVLFSAAVPGQPGKQHVNCQWPGYWARLFRTNGYVALDCIRSKIWDDERVAYWYAQNALIFCRETELGRFPELAATQPGIPLSLVHPKLLARRMTDARRAKRRYAHKLAAIEGSAWWRLGLRLAPVLRIAARVRRLRGTGTAR